MWNSQFELGGNIGIVGGFGLGVNLSIGSQFMFNRVSKEFGGDFDWSLEWTAGPSQLGGALTAGPVFGWGASDLSQVVNGDSHFIGIGGAAFLALTGSSVIAANPDQMSGGNPVTSYEGGGFGRPMRINLGGGVATPNKITEGYFVP